MLIKFLNHGTGDPQRAVNYLLSSQDHAGRPRAGVEVLRGDPSLVGSLAASLPFVHRYTSGVINWAPEDNPTDDEISLVLDDFERIAFAGLEPQQYCWSAILHSDESGRKHVHVFVARVELSSGRSMNIAPPGWTKTFDPLRDFWNYSKGWARPDDPQRARPMLPGRFAVASAAAARNNRYVFREAEELSIQDCDLGDALSVEPDSRRFATEVLEQMLVEHEINSREDVIRVLEELGTVHRVADDYISVTLKGQHKHTRFKGGLFGKDFDADAVREKIFSNAAAKADGRGGPVDIVAAEEARKALEEAWFRIASYNRRRYPAPAPLELDRALPPRFGESEIPLSTTKEVLNDGDRTENAAGVDAAPEAAGAKSSDARGIFGASPSLTAVFDATARAASELAFFLRATARASEGLVRASRAVLQAGRAVANHVQQFAALGKSLDIPEPESVAGDQFSQEPEERSGRMRAPGRAFR